MLIAGALAIEGYSRCARHRADPKPARAASPVGACEAFAGDIFHVSPFAAATSCTAVLKGIQMDMGYGLQFASTGGAEKADSETTKSITCVPLGGTFCRKLLLAVLINIPTNQHQCTAYSPTVSLQGTLEQTPWGPIAGASEPTPIAQNCRCTNAAAAWMRFLPARVIHHHHSNTALSHRSKRTQTL